MKSVVAVVTVGWSPAVAWTLFLPWPDWSAQVKVAPVVMPASPRSQNMRLVVPMPPGFWAWRAEKDNTLAKRVSRRRLFIEMGDV